MIQTYEIEEDVEIGDWVSPIIKEKNKAEKLQDIFLVENSTEGNFLHSNQNGNVELDENNNILFNKKIVGKINSGFIFNFIQGNYNNNIFYLIKFIGSITINNNVFGNPVNNSLLFLDNQDAFIIEESLTNFTYTISHNTIYIAYFCSNETQITFLSIENSKITKKHTIPINNESVVFKNFLLFSSNKELYFTFTTDNKTKLILLSKDFKIVNVMKFKDILITDIYVYECNEYFAIYVESNKEVCFYDKLYNFKHCIGANIFIQINKGIIINDLIIKNLYPNNNIRVNQIFPYKKDLLLYSGFSDINKIIITDRYLRTIKSKDIYISNNNNIVSFLPRLNFSEDKLYFFTASDEVIYEQKLYKNNNLLIFSPGIPDVVGLIIDKPCKNLIKVIFQGECKSHLCLEPNLKYFIDNEGNLSTIEEPGKRYILFSFNNILYIKGITC